IGIGVAIERARPPSCVPLFSLSSGVSRPPRLYAASEVSMRLSSAFSLVPVLGGVLLLGGCDAVTGTDSSRTRIVLSQGGSASPSFSVAAVPGATADRQGDRTAILALVDALDVTITAVQAQ